MKRCRSERRNVIRCMRRDNHDGVLCDGAALASMDITIRRCMRGLVRIRMARRCVAVWSRRNRVGRRRTTALVAAARSIVGALIFSGHRFSVFIFDCLAEGVYS